MPMKITLRQLEVFAAVANLGHVTRAAESVALTQSAASMALADLEAQLGSPLFDRVGRVLQLNEAGRRIQPRAQEILDCVREIEALASDATAAVDLRLGASLTIGNHLMPALLAELESRHIDSRIQLTLNNTELVLADLLAHRIDVGFVEGPVRDERIERYRWRADRLCVFAAAGHPLAGQNTLPDDLRSERWIVREKGSGTREVFDRALANACITPNIRLELEQPEAIRQSVRAGLGIGCLSILELQDAFQAGWLAPVETHFLDLERDLQVLVHRAKYLSNGVRSILSLCGIEETRATPRADTR